MADTIIKFGGGFIAALLIAQMLKGRPSRTGELHYI